MLIIKLDDDLMSLPAVAFALGVSPPTVKLHMVSGRLPYRRLGRYWVTTRRALTTFMAENPDAVKANYAAR